ncbi:MAG: response regulator, partial [bacterium]
MNKALVLGTSGKERELLANILKELGYLCDTADTAASIENIGEYSIFFLMFEPSEEFISKIENVVRESEEPVFVVTDLPKEDIRKMSVPFGIGAIGGPLELAQVKEQIEYYSLLWNSPLNIIIYEPDKYWNTLLVKYLTEEKHNAMAFDNGERFIYAVLSKKCDIVIVEINTIEELAILEHIVSQKPYAPILLIVPKNSWELTIKALLIGVSQYLHKPIKLQQLSIAINKTLLNSRKEGIERFVASLFHLKTKALSAKFEEILDEMGRREAEIKSLSLYKGSLQV